MTAPENAYVNASLLGVSREELSERLEEILNFAELGDFVDTAVRHYSTGMTARLGFAVAMHVDADILLVDEPVAGMTHQEIDKTSELLSALAGDHTVVVVEHDMDFVRSIARTVTVLHQGAVLAEGPMEKVQNDPKVVEVYLGE